MYGLYACLVCEIDVWVGGSGAVDGVRVEYPPVVDVAVLRSLWERLPPSAQITRGEHREVEVVKPLGTLPVGFLYLRVEPWNLPGEPATFGPLPRKVDAAGFGNFWTLGNGVGNFRTLGVGNFWTLGRWHQNG